MLWRTTCQLLFYFILQEYKIWLHVSSQSPKIDRLFLDTLLKVLFAISGVFTWFGHVAGNIYFALLPIEEDTAALHVFILDSHCAAHLAAPAQSTLQTSFGVRQTLMAL